jgi:hypothetical protein
MAGQKNNDLMANFSKTVSQFGYHPLRAASG